MNLLELIKLKHLYFTPLVRAYNIERLFNISASEIYLKWEGVNPTGTHKDRAAIAHVEKAIKNGYDTITVGTCGNFGVAISYFARMFGLRAVIFVPSSYSNSRVAEMIRYGAEVIFVDGKYEDAVRMSVKEASKNSWYDANPGSVNSHVNIEAYSTLAEEILIQLGGVPEFIAVPVGNGTLLAGIYFGFKKLLYVRRIERIPRFIATSTRGGNQIVYSWKKGSRHLLPLSEDSIVETDVNEPLVAYRSLDGENALKAIFESDGFAFEFDDEELIKTAEFIRIFEGLPTLPASASSLLALIELNRQGILEGKSIAVLTGRIH